MSPAFSRKHVLLSAIIVLAPFIHPAAVADDGGGQAAACPGPSLAPVLKDLPRRDGAPIYLASRQFDATQGGPAKARGQVELTRADQVLKTDLLQYDPATRTVTMPGRVNYRDSVMHVASDSARYSFEDEAGLFTVVDFGLTGSSARGSASEIAMAPGEHAVMRDLYFTTCPGEAPEWELTARELELDFETGMGKARHAKLEFFDLPLLYLPYMTFPIDDRRKSGFLYPSLSSANDNGLEISIPYYWNIAPNHDATIVPRYFTDRGAMITGEYRFLTRRTNGALDFDWLPSDKKTRELRYHYKLSHSARVNPRWRTSVLLDRVSDDQYFQDFSNSLAAASRQYLRSKAGIYGHGAYWDFSVIVDDFQVVDSSVSRTNEPYRRLPRVAFGLDRPLGLNGLRLRLDTELVYFDREIGVTGSRLDVLPRIEWNMATNWGYVRPSAGYRHTSYDLDWRGEPGDSSLSRGTGILSFDTGLFLQRDGQSGRTQTLEPRLFYLYVPYENQDDFPDFDSAPFTFGFSQLFHYNRFTGADRQADANQLTLALTTRTYDYRAGRELWSLSFGQIAYFENQRVIPPEFGDELDDSASPLITEFVLYPTRTLRSRITTQWDWQNSEFDVAILGITHTSESGRRLGAEYRYRRDSLDQFDLRFYQPLGERWLAMGRVNYSLQDSDLLAAELGFEYESCCWGVRVVARRFLRNNEGDHRDAIYLQLVLKGLGRFGRRTAPLFYDIVD